MQRLRVGNFQSLFASEIIYKSAWFIRFPHGLAVVWVAAACVMVSPVTLALKR